MRSLAAYRRRRFPGVPVHHLTRGCQYETVGPDGT